MAGRMLPLLWLVLAFCSGAFAQSPSQNEAEVEKAKVERRAKLIAAIEADTAELKLPENRAVVNAKIASALWSSDEQHARKLFRNAVNDLIAAQQSAEESKHRGLNYDLLHSQSLRPQIINQIANHDPHFALDALRRSRPPAVERAFTEPGPNAKLGGGGNPHLAQGEINLEQRLIRLAAQRDPERAVAILKDSVRKRLSSETFGMLQQIHQTDPAAANELARDVMDRLASAEIFTNNSVNYELLNLSNSMIAEAARERVPNEKALAFEDAAVRRIVEKVARTYIEYGTRIGWIPIDQLSPALKRFSPGSFEPLKKVAASQTHRGNMPVHLDEEYRKLMESNPSAEVLVSAAKRFEPSARQNIFQTAAGKYAESGQFDAARALLNDTLEGDALESALGNLNLQYANQLMQKGQFEAAEAAMMELGENSRVNALVGLATGMINASEENRGRAANLLNRVRGLLPDRPENSNELAQIFSVITTMATADPAEAARMMEPMVDQLNQLTDAFAIVHPFQGNNNIRNGEFILTHGLHIGVQVDPHILRMLGQKDANRADALVNGFTRREVRVMMRLSLLEGVQ